MTLADNPLSEKRLYSIDALRGLAALGVAAFYHWTWMFYKQPYVIPSFPFHSSPIAYWLYHYGHLLVELFFVISGYIFVHTYFYRIKSHKTSFYSFAIARIARLWPLFFSTMLFVFTLQIIRGFIGQEAFFTNVPYDVFSLTLSFFFLQSTFFSKNPTLNGPGWSVSAEIIMYILFYFLVKKTHKNILYFLATSGALVLLGIYTVLRNIDIPPLGATTTGRALIGFFMGCILYFLNQFYVKLSLRKKNIILCLLISWLLIVVSLGIKFGSSIYGELSPFYSICIYSPLIFLAVNFNALRKFLSVQPFRTLGDASYAIYLLNFPLLILINTVTSVLDLNLNFYSKKIFLLHLLALVALSVVIHNYFEKPTTYKLKKWLTSINHKKIIRKLNILI